MGYFDDYKTRLAKGVGGSYLDHTAHVINQTFADSPFYAIVDIDGEQTETRVLSDSINRGSDYKELTFRPYTIKTVGQYVTYQNDKYLIMDFDHARDIFPIARIQKCNNKATFNGIDYACIITQFTIVSQFDKDKNVLMPEGEFTIFFKYDSNTELLQEQSVLTFNGKTHEVIFVDSVSKKGLVKIATKIIPTPINSTSTSTQTGGNSLW